MQARLHRYRTGNILHRSINTAYVKYVIQSTICEWPAGSVGWAVGWAYPRPRVRLPASVIFLEYFHILLKHNYEDLRLGIRLGLGVGVMVSTILLKFMEPLKVHACTVTVQASLHIVFSKIKRRLAEFMFRLEKRLTL